MGLIDELIKAQQREREFRNVEQRTGFDRLVESMRRNAEPPFWRLQQQMMRLEHQRPFGALATRLQAAAPYDVTQDAHRGIAEVMRENSMHREAERGIADRMREDRSREAERGIAAAIKHHDIAAPLRLALEAQRRDYALGGIGVAERFRQPFADLERQMQRYQSRWPASTNEAVQLSAMQQVLSAVSPLIDVADESAEADDTSEADVSEAEAAYERVSDILDRTLNVPDEALDVETFKQGIQEVVREIRSLRSGEMRREVAKFFLQIIAGLIVACFGPSPAVTVRHENLPAAAELVARDTPNIFIVTADVLRVHPLKDYDSPATAKLSEGQHVTVLEQSEDWSRIEWTNHGDADARASGWVASLYLKPEVR